MSKKKDKRHKHERHAQHGPEHDALKAEQSSHAGFTMPPQFAALAAATVKQVNTPAFQQMIAGALGAAAQAFDANRGSRRAPAQPVAPQPPTPPTPPEPAAAARPEPSTAPGHRPQFATPEFSLPPEAQQAIEQAAAQAAKAVETAAALATQALGTAAAAVERWAATQGRPERRD